MERDNEFPLGELVACGMLSSCAETPCAICKKPSRACYEAPQRTYAFCTMRHFKEFINHWLMPMMWIEHDGARPVFIEFLKPGTVVLAHCDACRYEAERELVNAQSEYLYTTGICPKCGVGEMLPKSCQGTTQIS